MLVILSPAAGPQTEAAVTARIAELGGQPRVIRAAAGTIIAVEAAHAHPRMADAFAPWSEVARVISTPKRYPLASRAFRAEDSVVRLGSWQIGGGSVQVIAGPCAVESREQLRATVAGLVGCGIGLVRAGAYKPRTSPYEFQGLGEAGLDLLAEVKAEFGVRVVTEVIGPEHVARVAAVADALQIGSRNAQNYDLLQAVAGAGRPVLLKRGMAATVEEWLSASEYLLLNGCQDVMLCERGIKTFEPGTRNTLDVGGLALAKRETHLPILVDPSHAAGRRDLVLPLALAGLAAGADGLLVEAHCRPDEALTDRAQQLAAADMPEFMRKVADMAALLGKTVGEKGGSYAASYQPRKRG